MRYTNKQTKKHQWMKFTYPILIIYRQKPFASVSYNYFLSLIITDYTLFIFQLTKRIYRFLMVLIRLTKWINMWCSFIVFCSCSCLFYITCHIYWIYWINKMSHSFNTFKEFAAFFFISFKNITCNFLEKEIDKNLWIP